MFIFERARQSTSGGGVERHRTPNGVGEWGETQNPKQLQALAVSMDVGLKLRNCEIMTQAEIGHLTDWATQTPPQKCFLMNRKCSSDPCLLILAFLPPPELTSIVPLLCFLPKIFCIDVNFQMVCVLTNLLLHLFCLTRYLSGNFVILYTYLLYSLNIIFFCIGLS